MEAVLDFGRGCQDLAIILLGVWGRGRKWSAGRLPCYRVYRGESVEGEGKLGGERESKYVLALNAAMCT